MDNVIKAKIDSWLNGNYDQDTKDKIKSLMDSGNEKELEESFYKSLDFGTAGLRGILGVGTNRMNIYTVGNATQGLANYILTQGSSVCEQGVVIAYDSRNYSKEFATFSAEILSSNGINVYLFDDIQPIPVLSFTVRHLKAGAGIVITASHNPKEYNGYKVYWNDGAQVIAPHDKNIIDEVNKSTIESIKKGDNSRVKIIGQEIVDLYLAEALKCRIDAEGIAKQKDLSIVYTPIHGSGYKIVPQCLKNFGFENVCSLADVQPPDGNFPTVPSPNPEETSALKIAIDKAKEIGSDLVLGTDPDGDRVGMAFKNAEGGYDVLNGNQIATILFHYVASSKKANGSLTDNMYMVKTIVTSNILRVIADDYGVKIYDVLTGFKWIADTINKNPNDVFIFGCEESHGYSFGEFVRDKDAVLACAMIAELLAYCKNNGISMYEYLQNIYKKYGYVKTTSISVTKAGMDGAAEIASLMKYYKENIMEEIGGIKVETFTDYQAKKCYDSKGNLLNDVDLPASDVVQYKLVDGSLITVRPSGTEPKIKFYYELVVEYTDIKDTEERVAKKFEAMKNFMK